MKRTTIAALLLSLALVTSLAPGLALADNAAGSGDFQAGETSETTQDPKDDEKANSLEILKVKLDECELRYTDALHQVEGSKTVYYVKGAEDSVTPEFSLFDGDAEVPSDSYTVKYEKVTGATAAGDETLETATAPFLPTGGTEVDACEYKVSVTAKEKGSYTGTATARFTVVDAYNLGGRCIDAYFAKGAKYRYSVSPENSDYYVIPKSKVGKVLKSFRILTGGETGLNSIHNGSEITSAYYTVSYYKADVSAAYGVEPASGTAVLGDKLSAVPSTAGAYVAVIEGAAPYNGKREVLFDVQDKMKKVEVADIEAQKHTGKAIEPPLSVTYNGSTLQAGTDYVATYKKNRKVGTAKVTLKDGYKIQDNPFGTVNRLSKGRFFSGKKTATFEIYSGDATKDMYRMYNPNSGEHFYTSSAYERIDLVKAGWKYEGIGWTAPVSSSVPVYRLYSGTDHHYTKSAAERDNLVKAGWKYEGIGWYSDDEEGIALYRLYNPYVDPTAKRNNSGSHHYTTNADERDDLVKIGWKYEGISWYGIL